MANRPRTSLEDTHHPGGGPAGVPRGASQQAHSNQHFVSNSENLGDGVRVYVLDTITNLPSDIRVIGSDHIASSAARLGYSGEWDEIKKRWENEEHFWLSPSQNFQRSESLAEHGAFIVDIIRRHAGAAEIVVVETLNHLAVGTLDWFWLAMEAVREDMGGASKVIINLSLMNVYNSSFYVAKTPIRQIINNLNYWNIVQETIKKHSNWNTIIPDDKWVKVAEAFDTNATTTTLKRVLDNDECWPIIQDAFDAKGAWETLVEEDYNHIIESIFEDVKDNVLFIAAAGNAYGNDSLLPARLASVWSVGATEYDVHSQGFKRAEYSNEPTLFGQGIWAFGGSNDGLGPAYIGPGFSGGLRSLEPVKVISLENDEPTFSESSLEQPEPYCQWAGTSFACARVSGLAAVLGDMEEVKKILIKTGEGTPSP